MNTFERLRSVERRLRSVAIVATIVTVGLMDSWSSEALAETPSRGKTKTVETKGAKHERRMSSIISQDIADGMRSQYGIEAPDPLSLYELVDNAKKYFPDDSLNASFMKRFLDYQKTGAYRDYEETLINLLNDWERYYDYVKQSQDPDSVQVEKNILANMPDSVRSAGSANVQFQKEHKRLRPIVVKMLKDHFIEKAANYVKPIGPEPTKLRDEDYGRWFQKPRKKARTASLKVHHET